MKGYFATLKRVLTTTAVLMSIAVGCSGIVVWQNFAKTQWVQPEELLEPSSAAELISIVKRASDTQKRVRMTGSGHSYSDVAVTRDILLVPTKLNAVLSLDESRLSVNDSEHLVRVQSGIPILQLSQYLENNGLALSNMGGHHAQTIVGAAMTGTHGSGLNYGPISDAILSLQVVDQYGDLKQIEPTNGITNPVAFPGFLEDDPSIPVTLIQDDDVFDAMRVSIGSMGIVYAVVIQTEDKFWLREVRTKMTWEAFKQPDGFLDRMLNGRKLKDVGPDPDYYEVWFNPYANPDGQHTLLLTERYKSQVPLVGDTLRGQPGADLGIDLLLSFQKPLVWILNQNPGLASHVINSTLTSQVDDDYVDISYDIFTLGKVSYTDAFAVEVAFRLDQTIEAIERMFEMAPIYQAAGMIHTTSVTARFVKSTDAMIAETQGRDSMIIEIVSLIGTTQIEQLFSNYQELYIDEFDARLHWGLDISYFQGSEGPAQLFPRWHDWLAIYQQYNENGTFDGKVTDRLGISANPR